MFGFKKVLVLLSAMIIEALNGLFSRCLVILIL